jgi:hypothetical protein
MDKTLWIGSPGGVLPKYAAEVLRRGRDLVARGIVTVEVRHDDWCALLTKGGPCNCNYELHPGELLKEAQQKKCDQG